MACGFRHLWIQTATIILQDLCKRKLGWDDRIPAEDLERWKTWLEVLPKLEEFSIDRCFKPPDFGNVVSCQLHYFSDASQLAYGAVCYLRLVNSRGDIHCFFVMGKSRLAPLKPVTIPRMELSAAVLSTRLDRMLQEELEYTIEESIYWTDSTCVLRYVENEDKRFQTFVANRVSAIHEQSSPMQWRYVETKLNPADDASRGMTVEAIAKSNRWSRGPHFSGRTKKTGRSVLLPWMTMNEKKSHVPQKKGESPLSAWHALLNEISTKCLSVSR